jgi:hypothetical protein
MQTTKSFDWSQFNAKPFEHVEEKKPFDWAEFGGQTELPQQPMMTSMEDQYTKQKQSHPYLMKIAELLQGSPTLESLGKGAEHFTNAVEGTGLPSFSRGLYEPLIEAGRGITNLIPGVNIQKDKYSPVNINPYLGETARIAGEFAGPGKIGLEAFEGLKSLPFINKAPEAIKSLLAGSTLGAVSSPEDRELGAVLGGGLGAASEIVPSISGKITGVFKKENPYSIIQKGYDEKESAISSIFDETLKTAEKEGINKIDLPKGILNQVKKLGPSTEKFANFVDKAKEGDIRALRKLQTELWKRAQKYKSSDLGSENDFGDLLIEQRDRINNAISDSLIKSKRPDLAEDINGAMGDWRNLMETYHSHPTISKLVGPSRKMPSTNTALKEISTEMNRIRQQHPEINKFLEDKRKMDMLKKALTIAGIGGGVVEAGSLIKNLFD